MPCASGWLSTCARYRSMSRSRASGVGAATAQVLVKVVDGQVEIRLLVIHAVEAERAEQRLDILALALAHHQVAARIQQDIRQADGGEPLAKIGAPVLTLAVERRDEHRV